MAKKSALQKKLASKLGAKLKQRLSNVAGKTKGPGQSLMVIPKTLLGIAMIIALILNAFLLNYIFRLETMGCECAKDWRRDYIQYYLIFMVIYILVQFWLLMKDDMSSFVTFTVAMNLIMFVLGILFVVFALQYVHKLKVAKCECSEDFARDVLQIVAIIDAIVYGIKALNILIGALVLVVLFFKRR